MAMLQTNMPSNSEGGLNDIKLNVWISMSCVVYNNMSIN